ncbi:MAG TPA: ribosome biogenesis GTP-binding protein YihA/YsxC [Candidatus Mcinerneyibacterium sp.]|nr:ribosome biogenesis GTP-binding protein YihA/YsxC [Candidatus Mcinerneyibacterium sp.]
MRIKNVKKIGSYQGRNEVPRWDYPQILIAGRSNVGKSSFINTILKRKSLVKTSKKPGKTRKIDLFMINNRFILGDLPGYGYAKRSKKEIEKWKKIINDYLLYSKNIVLIVIIIDAKVGITDLDEMLMDYLAGLNYPIYIIASKADKLNQSQKHKMKKKIEKNYRPEEYHFFSSLKKRGVNKVYNLFEGILV